MGRNSGKRHSAQDQNDSGLKQGKDHGSTGGNNRPTGGDSQTERERNAGKEGGARRGEGGDRNGSRKQQ